MKLNMFLTVLDGKPYAAYHKEHMAKVYCSNFSQADKTKIVEGFFLSHAELLKIKQEAFMAGYKQACDMHSTTGFDKDCKEEMKTALDEWL